jgi:hypothetical protein
MALHTRYGFFRLDLLAGDMFDNELGFVSKADISLGYNAASGLFGALRFGGIYTNVKEDTGFLIGRNRNLGLNIGAEFGFSF